jgi:hypothetical protein
MNKEKDDIENNKYVFKHLKIKMKKFYEFYTCLMNCLPVFYENEINNYFTETPDLKSDDNLCPICLERNNNILLMCEVKIIFNFLILDCLSIFSTAFVNAV